MKKDEARRDSSATTAPQEGDTLSAVSALMAERRRFEGWLAALDARRATTPEHVFARVNADYQKRLDAVIEQLTSHTDGLRREMESLNERLVSLREEHQRAQDERAEAELRAHVGELSDEEWKGTAAASDLRLTELGRQQGEVEGEIARTLELLDATQRPAATPTASAEPVSDTAEAEMHVPAAAPAAEPVPERVAEPEPVAAAEPAAAAAPRPSAAHPQEELQIQERHSMPVATIPDPSEPALPQSPMAPSPPPAREPAVAAPPTRKSTFDELAFLSSVVDTPSGAVEPAPQDEPDEVTRRQTFARRSQEDAIVNLADSGSIPLVSKIPDQEREIVPRSGRADAMVRRDSVSDGAKTLKCGECGSMNYPTEWYCERCGAELASL